jgi:hypothetical protein
LNLSETGKPFDKLRAGGEWVKRGGGSKAECEFFFIVIPETLPMARLSGIQSIFFPFRRFPFSRVPADTALRKPEPGLKFHCRINMLRGDHMRLWIVIGLALTLLSAGTVLAGPDNFGGKGKGWQEYQMDGGTFHKHQNSWSHTKNFDSDQGAGKRFSQPGKAEGKANDNSVILEDGMHPGTQVLPGGNR